MSFSLILWIKVVLTAKQADLSLGTIVSICFFGGGGSVVQC
jgi:hypothetical protein